MCIVGKCNVLSYIFAEAHDTTEIDYNITCCIYSQSSIVHLSSYYQAYVAKSQGRRRHMGKGVDLSQTKDFDRYPSGADTELSLGGANFRRAKRAENF